MSIDYIRAAVAEFDLVVQQRDKAEKAAGAAERTIADLNLKVEQLSRATPVTPEGWKVFKQEDCGPGVLGRMGIYASKGEDWASTNNNTDHVWSASQFKEAGDLLQLHINRKTENVVKGGAGYWYGGAVAGDARFSIRFRIPQRSLGHAINLMVWGLKNDEKINGKGQWARFGEFNPLEFFASAPADRAEATLHSSPGKVGDRKHPNNPKLVRDWTIWHVLTVETTSKRIEYLLDGVPYFTVTDPSWFPENGEKAIGIQSDGFRWKNVIEESKQTALNGKSLVEVDWIKTEVPV